MVDIHIEVGTTVTLPKIAFNDVLANLIRMGYQTIGPRLQDQALIYGPVDELADLPRGYTSNQDAGLYRLVFTGHGNYFNITPGPHSWKQFLFPPKTHLLSFQRETSMDSWRVESIIETTRPYAFVGVRPCELAAIQIQDRVFLRDEYKDAFYRTIRQNAFILAVNCLYPGGTCFCTSMGTGPKALTGFDLCLTELEDVFLVEVGSEAGRMVIAGQNIQPASAFLLNAASRGIDDARQKMGRRMPHPDSLPNILLNNMDHPRYDEVAKRCLSCTNCTQVCPTCFCWDIKEENNLNHTVVKRERVWDSCFNPEYSYIFSGNTRPHTRSRYRQWITHKLGGWYYQFGLSGCVGCGRCITWCPAGIDITEEVAALCEEVTA